jgi:phosphate transport system substrate-binding protein
MRMFLAFCLLLGTPALAGPETTLLRVAGSTTMQPAMQQLAAAFGSEHRVVEFELRGGGSGAGVAALLAGQTDIAASSRFLAEEELAQAREREVYPVPFRIAYDAIIPVVNTRNPLTDLSVEQLGRIFRGETRNWSELGGEDRAIRVVVREAGSGTSQVWHERVGDLTVPPAGAVQAPSSVAVLREVGSHRGAIGYIGLGYLNAGVKPLRVDGVIGSLGNVRAGRYALARPLFLFTDGWPEGAALEFIDYVLHPGAGQRVIERAGLIPLNAGVGR